MNDSTLEKINVGNGRQKRAWAEALYNSLKGVLTGEGYRNSTSEEAFVRQTPEEQAQYIKRAIEVIGSVRGYEHHAEGLAKLVDYYHPVQHTKIYPDLKARSFLGSIDKWKQFVDKDGIYNDWKSQSESGKTSLSFDDYARENYRTVDTAFLTSDENPDDTISGFDLPAGMPKLPEGTAVQIVALGFEFPDGHFQTNDLYGVKVLNGQAKDVQPNGIYYDVVRDNPSVLKFMLESQKELGRARQMLCEK